MSQYLNIYIKGKSDEFIPIKQCGRSSVLYDVFSYAPYEKVKPIKPEDIQRASEKIQTMIEDYKKRISLLEDMIKNVCSFSDKISDKVDTISEMYNDIGECRENITYLNTDLGFLNTFYEIMGDLLLDYEYHDGDVDKCIDPDEFVYIGIECYDPSLGDIV